METMRLGRPIQDWTDFPSLQPDAHSTPPKPPPEGQQVEPDDPPPPYVGDSKIRDQHTDGRTWSRTLLILATIAFVVFSLVNWYLCEGSADEVLAIRTHLHPETLDRVKPTISQTQSITKQLRLDYSPKTLEEQYMSSLDGQSELVEKLDGLSATTRDVIRRLPQLHSRLVNLTVIIRTAFRTVNNTVVETWLQEADTTAELISTIKADLDISNEYCRNIDVASKSLASKFQTEVQKAKGQAAWIYLRHAGSSADFESAQATSDRMEDLRDQFREKIGHLSAQCVHLLDKSRQLGYWDTAFNRFKTRKDQPLWEYTPDVVQQMQDQFLDAVESAMGDEVVHRQELRADVLNIVHP